MAVASLNVTKSYADDTPWTEAKMDSAMESIENYTQSALVNNLTQLAADVLPAGYEYDNDGSGNLTNSIYNKQSASIAYTSAVSMGTSVTSWGKLTASLDLTITPEATGKYFLTAQFAHTTEVDNNGELRTVVGIVNETDSATICTAYIKRKSFSGGSNENTEFVHMSGIYNFTSTAAATLATYRLISRSNTVNVNEIKAAATAQPHGFYCQIHKI